MVYRRLSDTELQNVVRMVQDGFSRREVARMYNVSHSVINRAMQRFFEGGNPRMRHGGGRQRSLTNREVRLIRITARRNPRRNASLIRNDLRNATGTVVSTQTVRRRLKEYGLKARRPAACPLLTREHRVARRLWAETHLNWDLEQWARCMFADESRFTLHRSDGRTLVWRRVNERYIERMMEPKVAFGGGGLTIWGGISLATRTELVVLQGQSMNAVRYRELCILRIVIPFAQNFGRNFIFVDDNARPHRARIVNEALTEHNIERMDWPSRSPDCNPIEHVWSEMERLLNNREVQPQTFPELRNALEQIWQQIPQNFISSLIQSMPRRCMAVRRARGGPTRY